jgi:sugar-specific transcriptional regulator TrmB
LLENQGLDFAVGDMAKEVGISRPKAYAVIKEFDRKEYIKKSRIIGKTQLYLLNKENKRVKLFLRDFRECLRLIAEEHTARPRTARSRSKKGCSVSSSSLTRAAGKISGRSGSVSSVQ